MPGSLDFLLRDAGLLPGAVFVPSEADVGSAKKRREHPPVQTGLKIALHGLAGINRKTAKAVFLFSLIYTLGTTYSLVNIIVLPGESMTAKIVGLTSEEVRRSKEKHGDNRLERQKTKGFFKRYIENLNDPIIKILIGALVINAIASLGRINWAETLGIVAAILIATMVSKKIWSPTCL